jgi:nitric oxide synthase-interacting protein
MQAEETWAVTLFITYVYIYMHICFEVLLKCLIICYRPDGYLFDKEAILEYIITKKNEYCRKLKEYEKQKRKEEVKLHDRC